MTERTRWPSRPRQARARGMALFLSLVLLLVLTLLGISAVQTTTLETRMARNDQDALLAFQAAETALREAEARLERLTSTAGFTAAGNDGLWSMPTAGSAPRWEDQAIWDERSTLVTLPKGVAEEGSREVDPAAPPRYIIEHVATVERTENAYQIDDPYSYVATDRVQVFRITALGIGATEHARVMLQTTYGRVMD
ncbi:MAG: pilus assembly PilX family protein [Pseudomonadales bacterium]